jgi:hypothetical protein
MFIGSISIKICVRGRRVPYFVEYVIYRLVVIGVKRRVLLGRKEMMKSMLPQ